MGDRKEDKEETTNPFGLRKMKPFVVTAPVAEHEPWVRAQIKAFTGWANNVLVNRRIDDTRLGYEMSSGVYFIELLMKLEGKYLGHYSKTPVLKFHRMENLDFVLRFLRKQKVQLVGHTADLLVDDSKNLKMVLGLLWAMILRYQVKKVYSQEKKGDIQRVEGGVSQAQDSLLAWVQEQMAVSAAQAGLPPDAVVKVGNWKEDFQDGRVLCHLFNSLKPAILDVSGLKKTAARENLTSALQLAEEYLKIPQLLDVNLMVAGTKEPQSVMTYVSLFKERAMNPLVDEERLTALQKQAVAGLVHPASIQDHVAPSEYRADVFNSAAIVAPKRQVEKPLSHAQLRAASGLGHPSAIDVSNDGLDQHMVQDLKDRDLLSWVNRKTFKFGVQVQDLQHSWRDPVVMTALAKSFDSNVDMKSISQATAVVDVSTAMEAVKNVLNVTPMDPRDMVEKPSQPAIRQYVSSVREAERRKKLLQWLNSRISSFQVSAQDFDKSFQDPRVVSALVKSFHPASIDMANVSKPTAIPSVEKAMGVAEDKLDINRNMSPTTMIEHPVADEVVEYVSKFYELDRKNKLLAWVNKRIAPFDQQVSNFGESFQDPHVISAMVNSFKPDAIDLDLVGPANGPAAVKDISKAFGISLAELHIRAPMTPEDMAFAPEEETVMEYMREFKDLADKQELLAWCNKKIQPKGRHADNFTSSFQSPDTLGSLADHFLPGELDVDSMGPATAVKDVAKAMELSDAELAIVPRMSPMEMVKFPHENKCAGYISDFRGFERKEELLDWVNSKIGKYNLRADDFTTSFQNPQVFCALTKHFFPEQVNLEQVTKATAVPSVDKAMDLCEKELKVARSYSPEAMIGTPVEESCYEYIAKLRQAERTRDLLAWLNNRIRPFEVSAANFTTSFQDPKTLSALVKSFRPQQIDMNQVAEETALRDLKRAMDVAHRELRVEPSVGPSVMLNRGDEDSVYDYVAKFRQAEREQELLAWLNSEARLGQFGLHADNFESSFQEPQILTGLVQSFLPNTVNHAAVNTGDPVAHVQNAMDASEDKLDIAPTLTAQDMVNKPSKDATVEYVAKFREAESKRELLAWVNSRIAGYGLEAKDFGDSFKDPLILTGLVKSFDPSLSLANVGPQTAVANIDRAMTVCEQKVHVDRPMSASEMATDPDPLLVAKYVSDMREQEAKLELLKWLNGKIRPFSLEAKNFSDSFKDPKIVCGLVEAFKPYSFRLHEITRDTAVENVQTAFDIADQKFAIPPAMTATNMLERPAEADIIPYVAAFKEYEYKRDLLDWVNKRIAAYDLKAHNFGESFTDPHIFCGLVKSFESNDVDLAAVSAKTALQDVDSAMTTSEKKIGVKRSLQPRQLLGGPPNEELIMEYIAEFREKDRQGELLNWLNGRVNVYDVNAENFQDSFKDPKVVCGLVKSFEKDAVSMDIEAKQTVQAVDNALKVGKERLGVEPTATGAKILTNPNTSENVKYVADMREKDRLRELLRWLNSKIAPFGLKAQNFHSSFQDPRILSGLVKHFEPREISLGSISEQTALKDLTRAMDVGADKVGVDPNMTPEQMLHNPQEADVADYVADFREAEKKRELLAWLNSRIGPYELEAKDFDVSFQDPKIFGGLVKSFLPGEVDLFKMREGTAVKDVDRCMELSETSLGLSRQMAARTMIEHPQEKPIMQYVAAFKELADKKELLQWVNSKLAPFQLEAKDFQQSWKNPKIVTGLIQSFGPSALDVTKCDEKNPVPHIEQAMKVAEQNLQVTRTLSATAMATNPEESKVINYARKLRDAERTRELLAWLNSKLKQYGLQAADFSSSFQDPKIVCGLVKNFASEVPLDTVSKATGVKDVETALVTGERKCKVNRTSTPEALLSQPDEAANKNYVAAWRAYERRQELLQWVNKTVAPAGVGQVKTFDSDFQSGKVMVALVNAFKPDSIPLAKVNDNSKQTFVAKAFKIAEDDLKIPPLMDARTMCDIPNAELVEAYVQQFKDHQDGLAFRDRGASVFDPRAGRLNEDSRRIVLPSDRAANKAQPQPLFLARDVKKVDLGDNKLGIFLNENVPTALNVASSARYGQADESVHPGSQATPEVEWTGEVVKELPLTPLQQAAVDGWVHPASIVDQIEPADYKAEMYHPAAVPWSRDDMETLHENAIRVPPQPQWLRDLINGYEFTNYKMDKTGAVQKEKVFLFYEPDLSPEGTKGSLCWNLEGRRALIPGQKIDIHHIHELCIGKQTDVMKHPQAEPAPQACCFSVLGFSNSLNLEADKEETAQKWIEVLSYLMRGEREEIAERVKLTQPKEDQLYTLDLTDPIVVELIRGRNFTAYEYAAGTNGQEAVRRDVYVHLYPLGGRLGSFYVSPAGRRIRPTAETRGMPVNLITDVFTGKQKGVFLDPIAKPAHGRRCFALHSDKTDFQLNLEAQCTEHAKEWIGGVHHILTKAGKTRRVQNTSSTDITQTKVYKATYSGTGDDLWAALEEGPATNELLSACLFHVVVDLQLDKLIALLKHGASVHAIDEGQTPLHRCLSFSDLAETSEMEPVVRLLIAAQASKEVRDDEGKTPTDYCSETTLAALSSALNESRPLDAVIAQSRPSVH